MSGSRWGLKRGVSLVGCLLLAAAVGGSCNSSKAPEKGVKNSVIEDSTRVRTSDLHHPPEGYTPGTPGTGEDVDPAFWEDQLAKPYLIGAGDVIEFQSLDDQSLNRQVTVRYDGNISLPMIADTNVGGVTRDEAIDLVREAYSKIFKDPQLTLSVVVSRSKSYYVMGDVARPAEYNYEKRISLLDAINTAGGPRINQRAGDTFVGAQGQLTKAFIIRHVNGKRLIMGMNLSNLSTPGPHESDVPVYPGDVVYVPEGVNLVYVLGEVGRSGVFQLQEGTTLLQMLTFASGFNEITGRLRRVVLMRDVDETTTDVMVVSVRKIIRTGQDIPLKPGDVIYVPRKPLITAQDFVNRFTGTISPLFSLYQQAWAVYYTDNQFRAQFENRPPQTNRLNAVRQTVQNVSALGNTLSGFSGFIAGP